MHDVTYHDLGSSQFMALAYLIKHLKQGLSECIGVNITQYRCLARAYELGGSVRSNTLASELKVAPNVIAQSSSALERAGLIVRAKDSTDGRGVVVILTDDGTSAVEKADDYISGTFADLWRDLPDDRRKLITDTLEDVGESLIQLPSVRALSMSSQWLATIAVSFNGLSKMLQSDSGLSLVDWRILQAIRENGRGMLVGELASDLSMPSNTVTCSADRLVERALVQRVKDPSNLRTVTLEITDKGKDTVDKSQASLNRFAQENLWERLSQEQLEVAYLGGLELAKLLANESRRE